MILGVPWWVGALALAVTVLGAARLTRLVVHDDFPPAVAIRIWWDGVTKDGPWSKLVHCHFCASYWVTVADVGFFFLTFLAEWFAWVWWLVNATLAISYLAAIIVHHDEGRD